MFKLLVVAYLSLAAAFGQFVCCCDGARLADDAPASKPCCQGNRTELTTKGASALTGPHGEMPDGHRDCPCRNGERLSIVGAPLNLSLEAAASPVPWLRACWLSAAPGESVESAFSLIPFGQEGDSFPNLFGRALLRAYSVMRC